MKRRGRALLEARLRVARLRVARLSAALACLLFAVWALGGGPAAAARARADAARADASYAVLIDAGSSGSRAHVFRFKARPGALPEVAFPAATLKVTPGLSSYVGNPTGAAKSVDELVRFALERVPADARARTPVTLMATAGLRRVGLKQAESVLSAARDELHRSPFKFQRPWAHVLPGVKEGLFAWVAANYAAGFLQHGDPAATMGVVELGGASAQVTFVPRTPPPKEFAQELRLPGTLYTLYTHSFLGLGQEAAKSTTMGGLAKRSFGDRTDPCTPRGYVAPSQPGGGGGGDDALPAPLPAGNFTACREAALGVLGLDAPCRHERCAMNGIFTPEPRGDFVATENFFYTAEFFEIPRSASLTEMVAAGERYCSSDWETIRELHKERPDSDLLKYCFASSYMVAFLHDGLGFGLRDHRLHFANDVEGVGVDWTLGALIAEVAALASPPPVHSAHYGLWARLALGVAAAAASAAMSRQPSYERRRRQLSGGAEMDDVEKGR